MIRDARWTVAPGFEAVAAEFERNFVERGELGASFAAVSCGTLVVDVWGGIADAQSGQRWREDTLQMIFSGSKGVVAICLLMLLDRGLLEIDAPVCRYWPEFGTAGKTTITVRDVVTHRARLPGLILPVTVNEIANDRLMAELVAAQPQLADPRAGRAYHPLSFGWICGELIRRVAGRSVGSFLAEELTTPLNLDLFIGLPREMESRVSRLELAPNWGRSGTIFDPKRGVDDEIVRVSWQNPPIWIRETFPWNDELFHRLEIPGANCIATARSVAFLYDHLDKLISADTLALAGSVLERRPDAIDSADEAFGIGFELQTDMKPFGPPSDAFGHTGAGGSVAGRWPSQRLGFSYAMNLMRDDQGVDERPKALLEALYQSCSQERRQPGAAAVVDAPVTD